MSFEIPVKKKHIAGKGLYGYPRNHNGNNHKKTKKSFHGYSDPYVREDHVKVLLPNMKVRMFHGSDARHIYEIVNDLRAYDAVC